MTKPRHSAARRGKSMSRPAVQYVVIFASSLACFWPSLKAGMVFDDRPAIMQNSDVMGQHSSVGWNNWIREIFRHDFWGGNITSETSHKSYRPLTVLSFGFMNAVFNKGDPRTDTEKLTMAPVFHSMNILLHGVNCLMIFKYLRSVCGRTKISFLTSLTFAIHPVHSESVAGLVGRADLLYTFFLMSCLVICSGNDRKTPPWSLSLSSLLSTIGFGLLSLLSKEQGIVVIPLVLAHEVAQSQLSIIPIHFRRFFFKVVVLLICLALLVYCRLLIQNFGVPKFQPSENPAAFIQNSTWIQQLNFHYVYVLNFWLLCTPDWLCFDWSSSCVNLIGINSSWYLDPRITFILALWSILISLLMHYLSLLRRNDWKVCVESKMMILGLSFLILPFIPSSNVFVTVGFVVAERNLYLSVLGFSLLFHCGFSKLIHVGKTRKYWWIIYVITSLFLMSKCLLRSFQWRCEESLYKSGLRVCPNNAKVHYNVARVEADKGRTNSAIYFYRNAIRLYPDYEQALNNLANLLKGNSDTVEEARDLLERALRVNPNFAVGWMNLGIIQVKSGEVRAAEVSYFKALKLRKNYSDAHFNLGSLYLVQEGRKVDALRQYQLATSINKEHFSAWANKVMLLDELERFSEAEDAADEAASLFPDKPDFFFHWANILGKQDKFKEAEKKYLKAIELDGCNSKKSIYHSNLGVLYHRWKKFGAAAVSYEKALSIDAENTSARKNLKSLKGKY